MYMHWTEIQNLKDEDFKRYTGVKKKTFDLMVITIKEYEKENKNKFSRKFDRIAEDRLLIMLDYYREYTTFFHLGVKYKMHESTACRTVNTLEKILIQSGKFNLPKRRELEDNTEIRVILVDASEQEIERPKKNKKEAILEKRKNTLKNSKS